MTKTTFAFRGIEQSESSPLVQQLTLVGLSFQDFISIELRCKYYIALEAKPLLTPNSSLKGNPSTRGFATYISQIFYVFTYMQLQFQAPYIHHQFTKISNSRAIPNKLIKYLRNVGIIGSNINLLTYY